MDKIKQLLTDTEFNIDIDYGDTWVLVSNKTGRKTIEFIVEYRKNVTNYIASDYFNPSEFDLEIEITGVSDLVIYNHKSEIIEFTDLEINDLISILEDKLIGKIL